MGWRNLQDETVFSTGDAKEHENEHLIFSVKVCVKTLGCK